MDLKPEKKKAHVRKGKKGKSHPPRNDVDEFALQSKARRKLSTANDPRAGLMELPKTIDLNRRPSEILPDFVGYIEAPKSPLRKSEVKSLQPHAIM